jgi:hypothetical protein
MQLQALNYREKTANEKSINISPYLLNKVNSKIFRIDNIAIDHFG